MLTRLNIAPVLTADRLARLREIPGILKTPPASPHIEHDGILVPRGAITEISGPPGSGKTEWTLGFIAEALSELSQNSKDSGQHSNQNERIGMAGSGGVARNPAAEHAAGRVAWIEDCFTANPRGFAEHGVDLGRLLFIEGGKDSLWATHQVLRSQLFGAVVLWVRESLLSVAEPSVELRKLQLSAEQAGVPLQIAMDPGTRTARVLEKSPRSEEVDHERPRHFRQRSSRSGLRTA
jgi:hypothetical protein